MESIIIQYLNKALTGLDVPAFYDARSRLATNPDGRHWKLRDPNQIKGLVWHQELGWGTVEQVARYHTGDQSHLYPGGVESIAYTWAIRRDGQIVLCNDLNKAVWSQGYAAREGDENVEFCSVMFEGLFNGDNVSDPTASEPNARQLLSGLVLWQACQNTWEWSENRLYGHYLIGKPSCPGGTLETIIKAIRTNVIIPSYNFRTVEGRQQALKHLDYYQGEIDGIWGPYSKGALIKFQADHNLVTDGVWGPITEAAILEALKLW